MVGNQILLTINSGSSSCKAALFTLTPSIELIADLTVGRADTGSPFGAIQEWLENLTRNKQLVAIGHRFVHGGALYTAPQLISSNVLNDLEGLQTLDPLHAEPSNKLIRELASRYPDIPQVVCFDTSFFADLPAVAKRIALPEAISDAGVRRYGFHGLSYMYVQREFERLAGTIAKDGRVIYSHLGSGSSLAATKDGRVIDTTMGFSPVSGIPSSTRSGDIDPTIVSFVQKRQGITADEFTEIAQTKSGLLAVSGTSGDMKHLLEIEADDHRAKEAVDLYVYHVQKAIGALAATIGGLDSLIFTGGIGEESAIIRERVCAGLSFLGVALNADKNSQHEFTISADSSSAGVHVIRTNEAAIIAEQTMRLTEGAHV